jgi:restriction system protein
METPKLVIDAHDRRRTSILVNRVKGFTNPITEEVMQADRNLKRFIPTGLDDLYALPLQTVQAHYLNDFIREHKLEAPVGSAFIRWFAEEIPPQVTIQALIIAGDKVSEGRLVEGVNIAWREVIRMISRNPEEIYQIDPRKFEELIAGAYEVSGEFDEVILTPRSGDKGRDVIATKKGFGSLRIFDQIKRNRITHPVTADDVRALAGVIYMDQNVSKGVLTTSGVFAPNLEKDEYIQKLLPYRLELRPRDILIPWLKKLSAR